MNRHRVSLVSMIGCMIAMNFAATQGRAELIFSQTSNIGSGSGFSSQENFYLSSSTNTFGSFKVYDSFILSTGAVIDAVQWQGAYANSTNTANGSPSTTSWDIAIYESNVGEPIGFPYSGSPFTQVGSMNTILATSVTETASPSSLVHGFQYYAESATLSTPITLQSGVTYYLGIVSHNDPSTSVWGWASDGNGYSYQYSSTTNQTYVVNDQNRTFSLYGVRVVPEPSALALSALGGVGIIGGLMRKRRQAKAA